MKAHQAVKETTKPARRKKQSAAATPVRPAPAAAAAFPIVGIGASAGGLEALELFLKHMPASSGMAFVIVQHLDPTHKGLMAELLQRVTAMKVMQIREGTRIQPDCVYVIPPNKDLSILHGVLHLFAPVAPRGLRLPIDFFLRTLADDAEGRSIGVILSGMGSDGTMGLKAIKGKAGAVFVQDPASAKFDGMPKSAIDAGLADVVARAEALPRKILAYLQNVPILAQPGLVEQDDKANSSFEKIVILLRVQTGHDFSLYKKTTVYRRIERRMSIHQIARIASYARFLQENPKELELLFKKLLIGVTSFFRDPAVWEQVKTEVLPALLKDRPPSQTLRVWIPACATGEEAYSLAIVFQEALEQLKPPCGCKLQIFATDLNKDAIDKARTGLFPANIAADVSPKRLNRFFVPVEGGYLVGKPIREMVIFATQNLIMDPPFTRLDMVSCRNLLIYLTPALQAKLLPLFHYSLNPGGVLSLGSAETVGGFTDLFAPLAGKAQLYRRLESGQRTEPVEFPATLLPTRKSVPPPALPPSASLQAQAEHLLLQRYSPAAVLVNDKGDIIFINGRTGKYLEPAAGKANLNLFAMAREGLRYELSDAFRLALRQKEAVVCKSVKIQADAGVQVVDLTVQAIMEPVMLRGMVMVVFTDVAATPEKGPAKAKGPAANGARMAALERNFEQSRQELLTAREAMQTLKEEANSTNQELQSANEEMQFTNKELTTSTEEMRSMNEELQTLSAELQHKVDDLSQLSNDQKNLLDATEIVTLFLDPALRVRLFTAGANRVYKLIPGDVGRAITDIVSELAYPELADHAREVLRTLAVREQLVAARDGSWFLVRIRPFRTLENMIDGVVLTFTDITETKRKEEALKKANDLLRLAVVVRDAHDAITVQDLEGCTIAWNPGAVRMYGWSEAEALEMNVHDRIPEAQRKDALARLVQLGKAEILEPYRTQRLAKDGTVKEVSIISTALINEAGQMYAISTTERGGAGSDQ
jgi:two-component system CheB/CheR fusion protein